MPRIEEIYWRTECSFGDSHKHQILADLLRVSYPEAVGIVSLLFCKVRRHVVGGDLKDMSDAVIQRWCHSKKVTRAALVSSGWIDSDFRVHGWDERYGDIAAKREAERTKKQAQRSGKDAKPNTDVPDLSPPVPSGTNGTMSTLSPPYTRAGESESESESEKNINNMGAAAPAPKQPKPKNNPPATAFVQAYYDAHLEATGAKPIVAWDVTTKLAKAALNSMPLEEGLALLPIYFRDEIEPSAANFFTSWRLEKLRAALRGSGGAQSPLSNDDRRYKVIAAEVARIARLPASPWSFASIPFILGGRVVKVGGTADSQYWSWSNPNNLAEPTKHGDLTVTLLERAKADKIADADLAAWVVRTVTVRYDASEYGAA